MIYKALGEVDFRFTAASFRKLVRDFAHLSSPNFKNLELNPPLYGVPAVHLIVLIINNNNISITSERN